MGIIRSDQGMAIERSDSDSILMIMCLASAGGTITPTGIRIMVSYLDQTGLEHTLEKLRNQMYPVGSLYFSTNSTSPATIYGGTWERYGKGRTLVSVDESDTDFTAGKTGGEKTHKHGLIDDAYAMISWDANGGVALSRRAMSSWKSNVRVHNVLMPLIADTGTRSQAIGLKGNTDDASSSMPYIAVYIWRRTA